MGKLQKAEPRGNYNDQNEEDFSRYFEQLSLVTVINNKSGISLKLNMSW